MCFRVHVAIEVELGAGKVGGGVETKGQLFVGQLCN
jgi:hypothetical protein